MRYLLPGSLLLFTLIMNLGSINSVHATETVVKSLVIDDRSNSDFQSNLGLSWRLVTDDVMGGISSGNLSLDTYKGRKCLRMRGDVSTENNGGFVQISLALSEQGEYDASQFSGVEIEVAGNNEQYNIHFRTDDLWFPWQSYRASFVAATDWQSYRIPFASLEPYKTGEDFSANKLERIGLVAIGREFQADLCLASIRFYSE